MTSLKKPSLAETHPGLAAEALGWNPFQKNSSSKTTVRWRCPEGHHYSASIVERIKIGKSCNFCAIENAGADAYESERTGEIIGKIVERERVNNLIERERTKKAQKREKPEERHWTELYPRIAKQADGWDPKKIKNDSKILKNWICTRRHHFHMSVEERVKYKGRCKKCQKWPKPRNIRPFELAAELSIDHIELWKFSEKILNCELDPRKHLSSRNAEKIIDAWYDEHSAKQIVKKFEPSKDADWGQQVQLQWSINERCSTCSAMFDPQRPHECRSY
jgi:hypothetical protein